MKNVENFTDNNYNYYRSFGSFNRIKRSSLVRPDDAVQTFKHHAEYEESTVHVGEWWQCDPDAAEPKCTWSDFHVLKDEKILCSYNMSGETMLNYVLQECMPVRCIPPALYRRGSPWQKLSSGQRPPWTETPADRGDLDRDPSLDRDTQNETPLDRDIPRQKPPWTETTQTETLWTETPCEQNHRQV